MSSVVITK